MFLLVALYLFGIRLTTADQGEYFRGDTPLSYCDAKKYCQKSNGELATIRNKEQNGKATKACSDTTTSTKNTRGRGEGHEEHSCWLGLTEYVGTKRTDIEYQLWLWGNGTASSLPTTSKNDEKIRTYTLGYMNDKHHTIYYNSTDNTSTLFTNRTSTKTAQPGIPILSYEYTNWAKCFDCDSKRDQEKYAEPNNFDDCSESHVFLGIEDDGASGEHGFWYDVNAHEQIELLPLCEKITHTSPIHDHECDAVYSSCWYEQCQNHPVGSDGSKCWSLKESSSSSSSSGSGSSNDPPKCSENAIPKYTNLEMEYDFKNYQEYTCCDENDFSGRGKHGFCYDKEDYNDENNIWGAFVLLVLVCGLFMGICICIYCVYNHHNKTYVRRGSTANVQPRTGSIQMITTSQTQHQATIQLPANAMPGQQLNVMLPTGQQIQVTVPANATGGSVLTVQYQMTIPPLPSSSPYITNQTSLPPQNRDVPVIPENWNDKGGGGVQVIPRSAHQSGAQKVVAPMVISHPMVRPVQPVQPMVLQPTPVL